MTVDSLLQFLNEYGFWIFLVVVFLEYLNLPGFPSGVIMPLGGIWAQNSGSSVILVLLFSVVGGLLGSLLLYAVGYTGGAALLEKFLKKFPKQRPKVDKYTAKLRKNANRTLFVAKMLPAVRTLISVPAGIIRMNVRDYVLYSTLGIFGWNGAFIFAGYFFAEPILQMIQ